MRTVDQIIADAGGHEAVGERCNLSAWASLKWRHIGIPERHWGTLMQMVNGLTPADIYAANEAVRKPEAAA